MPHRFLVRAPSPRARAARGGWTAAALALACLTFACLAFAACATQTVVGRHLVDSRNLFELDLPAADWERVDLEKVLLALHKQESASLIAVNSTCGRMIGAPADVLATRLFTRFEESEVVSRETVTVAGRPAESVLGRAVREGRAFRIQAIVLTVAPCVYDLFYVAPEEEFGEGLADFWAIVSSFRAGTAGEGREK